MQRFFIKKSKRQKLGVYTMFGSYLLAGARFIQRNRLFTAINLIGLAIGMMSCILILLYVEAETSFDSWIPESEKIVRLHTAYHQPGQPPFHTVRSAGRMMEAIKNYAPEEIAAGVRLAPQETTIIQSDRAFTQSMFFADNSFFDVFKLPFAYGSAETSLINPTDTVISEDTALKYFGKTDVIGETMTLCCLKGQPLEVKITGVIKNLPASSHFNIEMLTLMTPKMFEHDPSMLDTWTSVNIYTYFKLHDGRTAEDLKKRIYHWLNNESPLLQVLSDYGVDLSGVSNATDFSKPNIMALQDLHLYARQDAGNMPDLSEMGDITEVYAFISAAGLILLIAAINFMNLSTVVASKRAREVALRKVLGATKKQIAFQFLGEAIIMALLALLLALTTIEIILPFFNQMIGKTIDFTILKSLPTLFSIIGAVVFIGLISGSYPALFLARFMPAKTLKANTSQGRSKRLTVRSVLVIIQFAVSVCLIVCTAVIYGQLFYAKNMDVGYAYKDKIILGDLYKASSPQQLETLQYQLANLPGVDSVVLSSDVPSQDQENTTVFTPVPDGSERAPQKGIILNHYSVGFGFMEAYGISPLSGRTFDSEFSAEEITLKSEHDNQINSASVIINESAMRRLGYSAPLNAVGKTLRSDIGNTGGINLSIIGVIPDTYFRSLKHGVRASAYYVLPAKYLSATITYSNIDATILANKVEQVWRNIVPQAPVSLHFLEDMMQAQYSTEEQLVTLLAAFAVLAIIVAVLGLYGLAAFSTERRTKEIGIRKVLGAKVMDIVRLLVWQFSWPVLISNIIAWPVVWFLMSNWLEGFEYRLSNSYLIATAFTASLLALTIAWITVGSKAFHVAQSNPITALRNE